MERRFSLSNFSPSARLANPMADSTRIDASSISSGHPAASVLGLSPRRQSSLLNGTRTPDRSFGNQTSASISRQKLNLSQLDPKTFADVHSSGLASRIVSYHDNSLGGRGGLQRSMSASNLYNPMLKPRRMPGAPLPYKATVPALSMTKIAPPERSFYSGNTLPSLLRSNSLVGVVHKASEQEQLSRENRPIMHPPHPQHDSEPTRSVLDELKEISRKRINSGDPQSPHDFTKRSCQRVDFVDHLSFHHHQQQHQQTLKRQRELTVAVPLRHHSMVLAAPPPTLPHIHSNGSISPQQSPEQLAKRRNCSINNGIASSLSSSRRHTNKRKLFNLRESIQSQVNDSVRSGNSPDTSPVENAAKVQRKVDAVAISKARSMPAASSATTAVLPRTQSVPQPQSTVQPAVEVQPRTTKPKLTLFNATQNEKNEQTPQKLKDLDSPDVDAGEYAGIQFVKPKQQSSSLGVRNPNADRTTKTKLAIMLSGLKGELYQGEPDELDATLPKAAALPTPIKPTVVAPTVPATTTETKTTVSPTKPVILSNQLIKPPQEASAAAASSSTITLGTITSTAKSPAAAEVKPIPSLPAVVSAPSSTAAPTPTTVASPKSTDAAPKPALFSFGTTSTASTTPVSNSTPAFSFGQKPTSGPLGGSATGFKLETPISKTLTTPTTTNTETPAATSLSFGAPPKPVTSSPAFGGPTKPATSSAPAINFGVAGPTAGSIGTSAPMPVFGAPAAASSAPKAPTATVAPLTSSGIAPAPGNTLGSTEPPKPFAFGQASSANSESSGGSAAKPAVFSFGGSSAQAPAPAAPQPTDLFGSQSKPPAFGGAFSAPTATKPEPAKPGIFGSQDNSFGSAWKPSTPAAVAAAPAEPTKPFSFNATSTTAPTASAPKPSTNLFSFGGATTPAKPAAPAETPNASTNPPIFGQAKLPTTVFAFGGGSTTGSSGTAEQNKPAFAFGGGAGGGGAGDASKPSSVFSFGGGDKSNAAAAAPAPSTATSTSNGFGFGQVQKPSTPMFGSGSTAPQDNTNAMGGSKPFSFGGSQQPAAPAGGGFSFASVAKKAEEPKPSTNIFGSSASGGNASFGFGGNGNNQAAAPPAAASGGFSFASVAGKKEEPASNNLFGNPATTNPGVVKPAFNFGGSTSSTPQAAPSFGGGSTSAPQAAPSFGGGSTSTPSFGSSISSTPQAAPSFGGFGAAASTTAPAPAAQSNKPFAFGGSSAGAAPPGGNLFASAVAAAQSQPSKPASFSFGAAAKPPASNATGNAPFSFGGAAAGGIASQPSNQSMNTPKQFSFGGASSNPVPNAFASPAPSPVPTNASAGAFNYGGAPATPTQPGPPGTPENRPIRKATRRLQK